MVEVVAADRFLLEKTVSVFVLNDDLVEGVDVC